MEKAEIEKLALLARIELRDGEGEALAERVGAVLDYVSEVNEIVAEEKPKEAGVLRNVMRDDEVTREPGEYTEGVLANAPRTKGRFIEVAKVLDEK